MLVTNSPLSFHLLTFISLVTVFLPASVCRKSASALGVLEQIYIIESPAHTKDAGCRIC
jgi:hypothetical protein